MNTGGRLKYARKYRKMSQDELSERIGVSRGVITNIELNKVANPQQIVIAAICRVLNIRQEWLLSGEGEMDHMSGVAEKPVSPEDLYREISRLTTEEQELLLDVIRLIRKKG